MRLLPALALSSLFASPARAQDVSMVSIDAPSTVSPGQPVAIEWTVRNNTAAAVDAFLVFRATPSASYDISAPRICYWPTIGDITLSPFETRTDTANCTWPTNATSATHVVGRIIVDDPNLDPNLFDNDDADAVSVGGPGPTLQPDLLAEVITPSTAQRGDPISVDWTVRNPGAATAGASSLRVDFVDSAGTRSTALCGPAAVASIVSGGNRTGSVSGCSIPANAALGLGRVEVVADAAGVVAESDETNNVGVRSITVAATPPPPEPDLLVSSASGPVEVAPGDAFTVQVGLRNTGTADATGVTTVVRWSTSSTPGSATDEVGRDSNRILSSSAPSPASVAIAATAPTTAAAGTAWLHVTVDDPDTVSESDESNNTRIVPIDVVGDLRPEPVDTAPFVDTAPPEPTDTDRAPPVDTDPATPGLTQLGCACTSATAPAAGWLLLGLGGLLGLRRRPTAR